MKLKENLCYPTNFWSCGNLCKTSKCVFHTRQTAVGCMSEKLLTSPVPLLDVHSLVIDWRQLTLEHYRLATSISSSCRRILAVLSRWYSSCECVLFYLLLNIVQQIGGRLYKTCFGVVSFFDFDLCTFATDFIDRLTQYKLQAWWC